MADRVWLEQQIGEWQKWLELAHEADLSIGLWDWDVVANSVTWSDETYRSVDDAIQEMLALTKSYLPLCGKRGAYMVGAYMDPSGLQGPR